MERLAMPGVAFRAFEIWKITWFMGVSCCPEAAGGRVKVDQNRRGYKASGPAKGEPRHPRKQERPEAASRKHISNGKTSAARVRGFQLIAISLGAHKSSRCLF